MKAKHRIHKRSREHLSSYVYFCDYSGTDNVVETINCSKAIQTDIIVEVRGRQTMHAALSLRQSLFLAFFLRIEKQLRTRS